MNVASEEDIFVPATNVSCVLPPRSPQKTMRNQRTKKNRKHKSRKYRR